MLYHATILVGGSCLYFLILKETWLFVDQDYYYNQQFNFFIGLA